MAKATSPRSPSTSNNPVSDALSTQFQRLIVAVYPHFKGALSKSKLSGPDYFVLLATSHFGKRIDDQLVYPLGDLVESLTETGLYTSQSGPRGFVDGLIDRGLLKHVKVTRTQKAELFPDSKGYSMCVVLTEDGERTLTSCHQSLTSVFLNVTDGVPPILLRPFLKAFGAVVEKIIARLHKTS